MRFSDYEQLRFERRNNGVLLITLDRPDKYNAADEQMQGELARVWADFSADPQQQRHPRIAHHVHRLASALDHAEEGACQYPEQPALPASAGRWLPGWR